MNLNEIKKRLEALNSKSSNSDGEKKNLFFKPSIGKQTIRVLPSKYNPDIPFSELMIYYGIGEKTIVSPANWGEKDPIMEFAKQLRQSGDKENWKLAKKLDPKVRVFAPIIVRGEEEEGVKLWQFGKEVYQDFLNMAADEEIGDYTDVYEGRDIKLTTVGPDVTGTKYNKTTVSPSLKSSSVSNDKNEVKKFLEEQPEPLKVFKHYTFEEVKQALQEWLTVDDENEEEVAEAAVPFEGGKKTSAPVEKKNYSLNTSFTKKSNSDKFDDLFGDDEN
jgi:hypothetical protein